MDRRFESRSGYSKIIGVRGIVNIALAQMRLTYLKLKRVGLFLLTYVLGGLGYLLIQRWLAGRRDYPVLRLPWDDRIPLVSGFVWVYLLYYILPPMMVLLLPRLRYYKDMLLGIMLLFVISFAIFATYPVQMVRPAVIGNGLSERVLRHVYATDDPPVDVFPSLHVAMSVLVAAIVRHNHRRMGNIFIVLALWIAVSTLFVKQHWIADVVVGALLGFAVYWLAYRLHPLETLISGLAARKVNTPDRRVVQ
jgi:membrane-associated phospholipid phosphatase